MTPGAESLDEHVGLCRQLQRPGALGGVLQVELDAALALVDGGEQSRVVAHRVAARRLDLQHVGARGRTRSEVA